MTITIPDEIWTKFVEACRLSRGVAILSPLVRNPDNTVKSPEVLETLDQLGKRALAEFMQAELRLYERRKAQDALNLRSAQVQADADAKVPPAADLLS